MAQLDLSAFFPEMENMSEDVVDCMERLRFELREYTQSKELVESSTIRMKASKTSIDGLFEELPDSIKAEKAQTPTTIAGETFQRMKKTISLDGQVIVMNMRVDTTFARAKVMKTIDAAIQSSKSTQARGEISDLKKQLEALMKPHITQVVTIEPAKTGSSVSR